MKNVTKWWMAAAAVAALTASAPSAQAFSAAGSDDPDVSDVWYVGVRSGVSGVWACDEGQVPAAWVVLDSVNSGLVANSTIDLKSGDDEVHIIRVNYPQTHCGETLRGLPYGSGFALTLVGGAGADTLEGGDGTDLIYGDELAGVCSTSSSVGGSDRLDGFYGSNQLFGCGGPDTLRADYENTNLDDVLFGYSGNDCLETNATGIGSGVFDCGAGTADKYHAPFATTGCETSVVSCP